MEQGELVLVVGNKSNHLFEIDEFATIEVTPEQVDHSNGRYLILQNGATDWVDVDDISPIKDAMVSKHKILKMKHALKNESFMMTSDPTTEHYAVVSMDDVFMQIGKLL